MELYTSLTRVKMAMHGGQLPPMTPLTESAKKYIDPAFTPGMGAIEEHPDKGCRCPLRGCGKYFHMLGRHLNRSHRGIGGATAVRRALSIPDTTRLVSQRFSEKRREIMLRTMDTERGAALLKGHGRTPQQYAASRGMAIRSAASKSKSSETVAYHNLRDTCENQLAHKLVDLQNALGREPTMADCELKYGYTFRHAVERVYGTFSNLKANLGMRVRRRGITKDDVYESYKAYHDVNGHLPSLGQAVNPLRTPLVICASATLKVLGCSSWHSAMAHVAWVLGVREPEAIMARGEHHGGARLDEQRVKEIRRRAADGESLRSIAMTYGVGATTVRAVITRRTWNHVPVEKVEEPQLHASWMA